LRSPKRLVGLLLIPTLIVAYAWQGGDLMKSRARTITDYETESSAATRIEAWNAAVRMVSNHPFIGVGLASFGPAFPDHSDKRPREAHNTFFQIIAESGILAGIMYLLIVSFLIMGLWKNGNKYRAKAKANETNLLHLLNEATLVSFIGLVVCSLFLSLQIYEIFYYLCLIGNSILFLSDRDHYPQEYPIESKFVRGAVSEIEMGEDVTTKRSGETAENRP
jgi:O-antigen ligase